MSRRWRLSLFAVGAVVLAAVLVHGLAGLPAFGDYHGVYGTVLNRVTVSERHATDVITAINFDYRGLDTMGEEFILFATSIGLVVLLREQRDEHVDAQRATEAGDPEQSGDAGDAPLPGEADRRDAPPPGEADRRDAPPPGEADRREDPTAPSTPTSGGRHRLHTSPALLATGRWLVGPLLVLGVYIVTHGQLTPGGGFQGGVVLAGGVIVVFVAGGRVAMAPIRPTGAAEALEAIGAGGYVVMGIAGLIAGMRFLSNFLPLGTVGSLLSSGTITSLSTIVGLEVAGALTLIVSEFVDQRLLVGDRSPPQPRPAP
jgi:multicomponent Na+:H+ antiporter subunit B